MAFTEQQTARNVILLIGDGMGLAQISSALYSNDNALSLEEFAHIGYHKTPSSSDYITDSAAGATAFSCGVKTYNQAIGMTQDTLPCKTLLEELQEDGYATGLVATATIVHATPAAFAAHQPLRWLYEDIAVDLSQAGLDLLIGGGKRYFDRRNQDERNLLEEMKRQGYRIDTYLDLDFRDVIFDARSKYFYLAADKHPLTRAAGREYFPHAVEFAATFLKRRSNKGFFLMAEGSQIDWGGHSGDSHVVIDETLDFDEAVAQALSFAKRDGETLLIITADHETGGMAINPGSQWGDLKTSFNHNGHTATMVPVFAYGPGAEHFDGIYENTEIYFKMKAALGRSADKATAGP